MKKKIREAFSIITKRVSKIKYYLTVIKIFSFVWYMILCIFFDFLIVVLIFIIVFVVLGSYEKVCNDWYIPYQSSSNSKKDINSKINKIDKNIENIIFIYDAPKTNENCHAQVMTNIVKSFFLDINNSMILHVPYKYVDPEILEKWVNVLSKNKKIYINLSTHPQIDGDIETYVKVMHRLSKKATITIATGNTYKLNLKFENNQTKIQNIDNKIWEELNKTIYLKVIKIDKNKEKKYLFSKEIKQFVEDNITNILRQYKISEDENSVIHYKKTLHTYFLIRYLQALDSNITFVSAHTPFSAKELIEKGYFYSYQKYKEIKDDIPLKDVASYDNNYSLDCRIDGLVDYNKTVRNFGQYPHTSNGTSQATPAVLAEKVLESIKKEKEKQ